MPTPVYTNDTNLVFLYRFATFPTDEQLLNLSQATAFTGLNSMQVSGTPTQDSNVPSQVEGGSGVAFIGTDSFHLHMGSGNQSGVQVDGSLGFSAGFFGRPGTAHSATRCWMGQSTSASPGAYWRIESNTDGAAGIKWGIVYGLSNGTSSLAVYSTASIDYSHYESVVAVWDTGISKMKLFVSGVLINSGSLAFSPGPSGTGTIDVPFRLGGSRAFGSQALVNNVGIESGLMAEAFFIQRTLTNEEVAGIAQSGIRTPTIGSQTSSDALDTTKDAIGAISPASPPELRATLWDATDGANPSGYRHIQSGSHPAFIKIVGTNSGIAFTNARQGVASDPIAITIRNMTSGTDVSDIKVWLEDSTSFVGVTGWEVSQRIQSAWSPNLSMSSGAGIMGKSFAAASSVLRSDLSQTISGNPVVDASSGEPQISQYIYVAFETNDNFIPATYGASGFSMRMSAVY